MRIIERDSWGVPHLYAEDTESLFCTFGWAQLHSHGDLILRLYAQAPGWRRWPARR